MNLKIFLIVLCFFPLVCFPQVHPDSLNGYYEGKGYYKKSTDTAWTITNTYEIVSNIDTVNCKAIYNGWFVYGTGTNPVTFYTEYSFCPLATVMNRPVFYSGDSLRLIEDNISTPPPNTYTYSRHFYGKRVPGSGVHIGEIHKIQRIEVTPNPFSASFQIILPNNPVGLEKLQIYNAYGQLVKIQQIESVNPRTPIEIDGSFLPSGVYFIIANGKGTTYRATLIKD